MPSYGPFLSVGDVIEVTTVCRTTDQIGLNVLHYVVVGAGLTDSMGLVVQAMEGGITSYSSNLKDCLSVLAEFRGYMVRRIFPAIGVTALFPDATGAGVGTVAGDMLPRQVSGLISKRVLLPGRRQGGRAYIPFPGEGDNGADSLPTAGYVTRLAALAVTLGNSAVVGLTFVAAPCVVRITHPAGVMTVSNVRPFRTTIANSKWATQRRRGSYGKVNVSPL